MAIDWEQKASVTGPSPLYLLARGMMAHYVASQSGVTPEQAHQVISDEIVEFGEITPAATAALLDSAIERAREVAER